MKRTIIKRKNWSVVAMQFKNNNTEKATGRKSDAFFLSKLFALATFTLCIFFYASCSKDEKTDKQDDTKHEPKKAFIEVADAGGNIQPDATIKLFANENDLLNDTLESDILITDSNGKIEIADTTASGIYVVARKNGNTNLYSKYFITPETASDKNIYYKITVAKPTQTQLLCGHGSKRWLMTHYSINGNQQSYEVISVLNSDGTWDDSNNRSGAWWGEEHETKLSYDYGSGFTVSFDVVSLTEAYISLKSNEMGMNIEMEMTAIK